MQNPSPRNKYVNIAQMRLHIELIKKFQGMEFRDLETSMSLLLR